ncbi:MAG: DUF423 domain-containing protein [Flavobacterium sp.]|nr:DUF423 domain-containing protein [Flavobacterium sp.]
MDRQIQITAGFMGMIAIILGAFGAHALKAVLSVSELNTFETGVKYQMYHALFLLFLGLNNSVNSKIKRSIFLLISFGILLFSGSIYLLATMTITNINFKIIGIVTPIGGLLLIVGWGLFALNLIRNKS